VVGEWKVVDGGYQNTDMEPVNSNAYMELKQEGDEFIYEWTVEYLETTFGAGPAAGMQILCSDGKAEERGNSYLVFQDKACLRVYKSQNNVLGKAADLPCITEVGKTYTYRVVYTPKKGFMEFFRDGEKVGVYRDINSPIKSGQYISLRTNGTNAIFKDVKVTIN
jgi:hypothetical protein